MRMVMTTMTSEIGEILGLLTRRFIHGIIFIAVLARSRSCSSCSLMFLSLSPPPPPPSVGGDWIYLNSSNSGCARLGSRVTPTLGVVKEEVAVLIALVCRHGRAVGAAVRRAVDGEVPGVVLFRARWTYAEN